MEATSDTTPKEIYNIEVTGCWGRQVLLNVSEYQIDKDGYLIVPVPKDSNLLNRDLHNKYIFRNWDFVRIILKEG